MIYQKDWLMRQIAAMIEAVMNFLTNTSKVHTQIQPDIQLNEQIDIFLQRGEICTAEDWIYENMDENDLRWLMTSVYFYSKLNTYTDEYLEKRNFSREEIVSGLTEIFRIYGFDIFV